MGSCLNFKDETLKIYQFTPPGPTLGETYSSKNATVFFIIVPEIKINSWSRQAQKLIKHSI